MLPCLTFPMTHTWLRILSSPTRTHRISWLLKFMEKYSSKKYWNPCLHGLSFWDATCTGFGVTFFSNTIPVQGDTPRRENMNHSSVSMVFMLHTPRCFWSTHLLEIKIKQKDFRGRRVCLSFLLLYYHCKQCSVRNSPWADILWWRHSPCSLKVQVPSRALWVSHRFTSQAPQRRGLLCSPVRAMSF